MVVSRRLPLLRQKGGGGTAGSVGETVRKAAGVSNPVCVYCGWVRGRDFLSHCHCYTYVEETSWIRKAFSRLYLAFDKTKPFYLKITVLKRIFLSQDKERTDERASHLCTAPGPNPY